MSEYIDWNTKYPIIDWCGIEWHSDMEDGRKIHPNNPYYYYHPSCIRSDSNGVTLTIKDRPAEVHNWNQSDGVNYHPRYAVGLLRSVKSFGYGDFELKCILPKGRGLWSAFWLTHTETWPPEIDVFESYSNVFGGYVYFPLKVCRNPLSIGYKIQPNIHYGTCPDNRMVGVENAKLSVFDKPAKNISTFKLVWRPCEISIYYNNVLVKHINDITHKEVFQQIDSSPCMDVIFDIFPSDDMDKSGQLKAFKKNVNFRPEFILKDFKYTSWTPDLK